MRQIITLRLIIGMSIFFAHPIFSMSLNSLTTICKYIQSPKDINKALPDGTTPLNKAIISNDYHLADWLLAHEADPNGRPEGVILTPLTQFIQLKRGFNKKDTVFLLSLLHHGAHINGEDGFGNTALMQAAQTSSSHKPIEFLLDQGGDLALRTRLDNTIFFLGIKVNNHEHMQRYFKELQDYHEEIIQRIAKLAQLPNFPKELCPIIYSYASNAYPSRKKPPKA